ncbi:MAG: hypothetical protein EOO59_02010, partial [Hymenobacter sp.]
MLLLAGLPLVAPAQRQALPMQVAARRAVPAAAPAGAVLVSGHVAKPTARTISLSYGPDWRGRFTQTVEAPVSAAGDFRLVLPQLAAPAEARLDYGRAAATLYLTPGDALRLTVDPARFDQSLAFAGTGANANNYLIQSYLA